MELIIFAIQISILAFSVISHEIGHAYAALALGDQTAKRENRLSLNPIYHIDPFYTIILPCLFLFLSGFPYGAAKPVPITPHHFKFASPRRGMMLVAAAGPLVNVILALVALGITYIGNLHHPNFIKFLLFQFFLVNVLLVCINLIPIPPLDGSKIMTGLLPKELAEKYLSYKRYGFFVILFILLTGLHVPFFEEVISFCKILLPENYLLMS